VVARYSSLPSPNPGLIQGAAVGNAYSSLPAQKNMGMWVSSSTSQVWGRGIQSDGTQRNVTMATALSSGQAYVLNTMYRQTAISQYVDHGAAGSVTTNGTLSSWTDMAIGCQAGTEGWNGDISEVVVYNVDVNEAQRIIIANYLSAKYGTGLSANDIYREDNSGRGDFDHEVAGIGRVNASNIHTDAKGSGIVRISGATDLGDNEFLMWGHNNGVLGAWGIGDVPGGMQGRLGRVWRVSERNIAGSSAVNVGAVDVEFDLAGLGPVTASHLRLVVDTDNDGAFSDETGSGGAILVAGSRYRFNGVTELQDGRRFTLGTTDMGSTPLPVEFIAFSATRAMDGTVLTMWSTASEQDNDRFTVQRSLDTDQWMDVATVDAVGNSNTLLHYEALDTSAPDDLCYYRVQQTDLDGTTSYTDMVAVVGLDGGPGVLHMSPNPSQGELQFFFNEVREGPALLRLIDPSGRVVFEDRRYDGPSVQLIQLPSDLSNGRYTVLYEDANGRHFGGLVLSR